MAEFNLAYARDQIFRLAHHGETVVPLSGGGLLATAFELPERVTPPAKERWLIFTLLTVYRSQRCVLTMTRQLQQLPTAIRC